MATIKHSLLAICFVGLLCTSLTAQEVPGDAFALQQIREGNRDFALESFAHIQCDKPNQAYSQLAGV